ncbi:hypothetical protein SKAU_G00122600 [Synaphobranchus kaupii]|uniref:Uncharacterized protein n=1 Tax=Synaphobranchus kaupii TaxID=118154 RepID=A0A9Q1FP29_SYNKA|nr:hypothetical protein SKAU_G00122600 [Synaphobranchus kaupii]
MTGPLQVMRGGWEEKTPEDGVSVMPDVPQKGEQLEQHASLVELNQERSSYPGTDPVSSALTHCWHRCRFGAPCLLHFLPERASKALWRSATVESRVWAFRANSGPVM